MFSYIVRRLLLIIPTLLGISAVVFFVMALSPGGVGASLLSGEGELKAQDRKALEDYYNRRYGLDKPPVVQYVRWLNQISPIGFEPTPDGSLGTLTIKMPDLGESLSRRRPVTELIGEALPLTLLLNAISLPVIYAISILAGIRAARHRGKIFDLSSGATFLALWSLPTIWVGVMLIGLFANKQYLHWFPAAGLHDMLADSMPFLPSWVGGGFQRGYLLDVLWHLALPIICLSYGSFAFLTKLTRGSMLDNIAADYVRTARAKGVDENDVIFTHVFRNSLIPLITVAAHLLPGLLAGSVVVESIFSIEGMGKLMVDAVKMRDRELVMASALIGGILGLAGYLLSDICYAMADPRVTYE